MSASMPFIEDTPAPFAPTWTRQPIDGRCVQPSELMRAIATATGVGVGVGDLERFAFVQKRGPEALATEAKVLLESVKVTLRVAERESKWA